MADEEEQESRGFKVHDRRRFSDSGDTKATTEDAASDPPESPPVQPTSTPTAAERPDPMPGSPGEGGATAGPAAGHAGGHHAPEINFPTFVISLSTQALAHLGEIPDPVAGDIQVDLGAARQLIDILGMLKDKTAGNLDTDEATLLEHALYDLRMKYVESSQKKG